MVIVAVDFPTMTPYMHAALKGLRMRSFEKKPRTHCICSAQSGVSKATYEMTYLMHTRLHYNTWSGH